LFICGARWTDKNAGQRWPLQGSIFLSSFFVSSAMEKERRKKNESLTFKIKHLFFKHWKK
jgi:hypothetical protein